MIILASVMWYVAKLSHDYTVEMPVTVDVDGCRFDVDCVVEGSGRQIFLHRYLMRNVIKLNRTDVRLHRVQGKENTYTVAPASLQKAVSKYMGELKVGSVGQSPEITFIEPEK